MRSVSSLFQRKVKALVWVAFALLAVLPMLALVRVGLLLANASAYPWQSFEVGALCMFILISVGSGAMVLMHVANRLREITQNTMSLETAPKMNVATQVPAAVPNRPASPKGMVQNELASLTDALSRIRSDFTDNLNRLQRQASFLENLQRILDQSGDMVVIVDGSNSVTFSNQAAREKLGLLPDVNMRHSLAEGLLKDEDASRLAAILESWEARDEDLQFNRADGGTVFVHCIQTVAALPGQEQSKIIVLRDTTERRKMERQLYRSEQLAALGQLISGVAHELNNPLAAVLGFAELCRDSHLDHEELQRNLEIIEREASRTAHIVENLLTFSRQHHAKKVVIDVHDLVERCFTLLAYNFRTNSVTIRRSYSGHVGVLEVDEYQVQQVFINLIINASQAMKEAATPAPCITLSTRISEDGKAVLVEVADNGPGIPSDILPRIFEPFFTTKKDDQGTGLGLTISRSIVRNHKGDITVATRLGSGTTFTISLPVPAVAAAPADKSPQSARRPELTGHVLVVDDEPSILAMTQQALSARGLQVSTATSLKEALTVLQRTRFDLILADICMPDGEGTEIWDFVRILTPEAPCPIVFVTGDPQMASSLKTRLGTDVPTLIKPFHVNDLCGVVRSSLRRVAPVRAVTRTA